MGSGETREASSLAASALGEFTTADILLVVDDSASMADKQRLLADLFTVVLGDDSCTMNEVDEDSSRPTISCTNRFPSDTHIGVITTSLAIDGSASCAGGEGHLVPTPDGKPFLVLEDWLFPPYDTQTASHLREWFTSVGQSGCGFEAPLESAYRFLVDPEPRKRTDDDASSTDTELLEQREAFLRPDSFVFVVMLTDEDDCSLSDSPVGVRMANSETMAPATSACASDPGHACCRSCGARESEPPAGCAPLDADDGCARSELTALEDHLNVRCHQPAARFGMDGRFPVSRYIEGFTSPTLSESRVEPIPNPLFANHRQRESVRLLGIVGVPWQFVATEPTTSLPNALKILSPEELVSEARWPLLLESEGRGPDPHLIESLLPRPGLAPPNSAPDADPIHGHEYDNPMLSDLQYSCTFPLPEPRDCSRDIDSCDCTPEPDDSGVLAPTSPNRPLCQHADGSYGQTQYLGKAYPPPRLLEVLRETRGVVGSVCPKTVDSNQSASTAYGYTAAFRTLTEDVSGAFGISCLERPLPIDDGQLVGCKVVEVVTSEQGCEVRGRTMAPKAYASVVRSLLLDGEDDTHAFCEILPVVGDPEDPDSAAHSCLHDVEVNEEAFGYCFIDPSRGLGDAALVERCPRNARRRVRLVPFGIGRPSPTGETTLRLVCL